MQRADTPAGVPQVTAPGAAAPNSIVVGGAGRRGKAKYVSDSFCVMPPTHDQARPSARRRAFPASTHAGSCFGDYRPIEREGEMRFGAQNPPPAAQSPPPQEDAPFEKNALGCCNTPRVGSTRGADNARPPRQSRRAQSSVAHTLADSDEPTQRAGSAARDAPGPTARWRLGDRDKRHHATGVSMQPLLLELELPPAARSTHGFEGRNARQQALARILAYR